MNKLSQADRDTLNAAEQILISVVRDGGIIMASIHAGWTDMSVTYFTPNNTQHTAMTSPVDNTLAGKIDHALALRADEDGRADQIKAERIEKLKAELLSLTSEALA